MRMVIWKLLSVEGLARKRNLDGQITVSKRLKIILKSYIDNTLADKSPRLKGL